jgi:hypothetical protein
VEQVQHGGPMSQGQRLMEYSAGELPFMALLLKLVEFAAWAPQTEPVVSRMTARTSCEQTLSCQDRRAIERPIARQYPRRRLS